MKRKNRNSQLGYLPVGLDRSIFEKRIEYISSLHPIAQAIVLDFEKYFSGNDSIGYSYATLFKTALDAHKARLGDKTITSPVQVGFDTSKLKLALSCTRTTYNPNAFNTNNWDCDSMMILDILSYCFATPTKLTDPYVIYSLTDLTMPTVKLFDSSVTTNPYTYYTKNDGVFWYGAGPWYTNQMIVGWGPYANGKNGMLYGTASQTILKYLGVSLITVETRSKNSSTGAITFAQNNYYNVTTMSISQIVAILDSALTMLQWLESENNAVEIRGNVDGVKVDGYEKILADQLTYLNGITDAVQQSLINEKVAYQEKKDATLALIEAKKKEIELAKQAKKDAINKLTDYTTNYNTLLQSKKDELMKTIVS